MRIVMVGLGLATLLLAGCEKMKNSPVEVVQTPLVGSWYGEQLQEVGDGRVHDQLFIQVKPDGYVDYHFLSCELIPGRPLQEKRLDLQHMPVIRLNTVKMVLQNYPLTPKFELTLGPWPDENGGQWVVDDIALRAAEPEQMRQVTEGSCSPATVQ